MSDTPLADALKDQYCFSHLDWYKLCGELERENAALRSTLTLIRSTTDESGLSQARVIETVGKYCDEILGKEKRT